MKLIYDTGVYAEVKCFGAKKIFIYKELGCCVPGYIQFPAYGGVIIRIAGKNEWKTIYYDSLTEFYNIWEIKA